MIRTKKDLHWYLAEDARVNRMQGVPYWKYLIKLFAGSESAHVYRYIKRLRYTEYHHNNKGLWHKLLYYINMLQLHRLGLKYNIRIPINITGYGLGIYHTVGVILNAEKVGDYCILQSGILVGISSGTNAGKPILGNHVVFGPGAKVLGKIKIGNNCFIGANAVVTKDVPDNSFVGGIPAKVIKTFK